MRILLSGYYGYGNAGDEAVLAAILTHLSERLNAPEFVVTSGNIAHTEKMHAAPEYSLRAVARDDFKVLWQEIRSCDLFISGGGSLLQDVTSLRNILYYTGLIRMAHFARKPVVVYAQGIGPLQKPLSQRVTRSALQHGSTRLVTVRDPDSKALLQKIGVRREVEITADPVWALANAECGVRNAESRTWCVSLRSWPGASTPDPEKKLLHAIRAAAREQNATLRFLAMQPERDRPLIESFGVAADEILDTQNLHPREIMRLAGECDLMIAMRLHALIFAAAQRVPCVAVSYDPKVASLAKIIGAPVISDATDDELAKLDAAASAEPITGSALQELQASALRTAELTAHLLK